MPALVSVAIRVHNNEQTLRQAINSALEQTYDNIEIVIVDDGSTDRSQSIIEELMTAKMRYVYEDRVGRTQAAQRALTECRGDYVAVLDADDVWMPTKIEKQMKIINENADVVLVTTFISLIDEKNKIIGERKFPTDKKSIKNTIVLYNCITHSAALFHRNTAISAGGYQLNSADASEDYDLWLRIMERGEAICIPENLVEYRVSSGPLNTKRIRSILEGTRQARTRAFKSGYYHQTVLTRFVTLLHEILRFIPTSLIKTCFNAVFYGVVLFRSKHDKQKTKTNH